MSDTIPVSVLKLLKHAWKPTAGYSSFESVFNDKSDLDRRTRPSYYHIHVGKEIEYDGFDVLTHAEARELVKEGIFGSLAVSRREEVTVNEHAQHALTDFCFVKSNE